MYRVLIVDDEPFVCQLLQKLIRWDALSLRLLGTAEDGFSAWERIREERPDIVITDIRMPGLDGLELVRRTREAQIDANFIIISGHTQFEYAFSAIKYGVEDYLVKPINQEELNEVLGKICGKRSLLDRNEQRDALLRTSLDKLRENYLLDLIGGRRSPAGLAEFNESCHCAFVPGLFQVIAVRPDGNAQYHAPRRELEVILSRAAAAVQKAQDFAVVTCIADGFLYCVFNFQPDDRSALAQSYRLIMDELFTVLNLYRNCEVTLGLSDEAAAVPDIPALFGHARDAVAERLTLGCNRIIPYGELPPDDGAPGLSAAERTELLNIVESCCADRLLLFVSRFLAETRSLPVRDAARLRKYRALLLDFFGMMQDAAPAPAAQEAAILRLKEFTAPAALHQYISQTMESLFAQYCEQIRTRETRPVADAKAFIEAHLSEDLTLERVAAQVYLNPAYFSILFKNEEGENFSKYITNLRISKAKDYLKQPPYSVAQVSELVGYRDQKHFSKLFKKIVGINPSDYKKLHS